MDFCEDKVYIKIKMQYFLVHLFFLSRPQGHESQVA